MSVAFRHIRGSSLSLTLTAVADEGLPPLLEPGDTITAWITDQNGSWRGTMHVEPRFGPQELVLWVHPSEQADWPSGRLLVQVEFSKPERPGRAPMVLVSGPPIVLDVLPGRRGM
jgi:hypothetical protein